MPWPREGWPLSLSARLLAAYLGAWLLLAALLGGALAWVLQHGPTRWSNHSAPELAQRLASTLYRNAAGEWAPPALPAELSWLVDQAPLEVGFRLFDERGHVLLWSSPAVRSVWTEIPPVPEASVQPMQRQLEGLTLLMYTVRVESAGPAIWLQVGLSERLVGLLHARSAVHIGGSVLGTIAASIALLALVQFVVARRLMRPVRRLAQQASNINLHHPGRRLATAGLPKEVHTLVVAFNACLQRMEEAHARHVGFMADAAHELKTPLTLLRAQLELGDADPQALLADVDSLSRQVQQWLVLAEVAEPRSYRHEAIDVQAVSRETLRRLTPLADQQQVCLRLTGQPGRAISGDPSALAVMLKNLVENAIQAAPAQTAVTLEMAADGVFVRDQGAGIAESHLPHLFQRFWRAPERRDAGAGLGLSICAEVAQAHGWQLGTTNRNPGAEFSVRFSPAPA